MKFPKGKPGKGANYSLKLHLIRKGSTLATNKYGTNGVEKIRGKPRPITLPKLNLPDPQE